MLLNADTGWMVLPVLKLDLNCGGISPAEWTWIFHKGRQHWTLLPGSHFDRQATLIMSLIMKKCIANVRRGIIQKNWWGIAANCNISIKHFQNSVLVISSPFLPFFFPPSPFLISLFLLFVPFLRLTFRLSEESFWRERYASLDSSSDLTRRGKTKKAEGNAGETGKIYSDLLIFRRKLVKLIPAKTLSGQIEEKQIKSCEYAGQRASS